MSAKETKSEQAAIEAAPARRAYRAPRLRQLGSVRELTLGGTVGNPEGGGTKAKGKSGN